LAVVASQWATSHCHGLSVWERRAVFWAFEVVLGIQSIAEVDRRRVARQVPVNSRQGCRV